MASESSPWLAAPCPTRRRTARAPRARLGEATAARIRARARVRSRCRGREQHPAPAPGSPRSRRNTCGCGRSGTARSAQAKIGPTGLYSSIRAARSSDSRGRRLLAGPDLVARLEPHRLAPGDSRQAKPATQPSGAHRARQPLRQSVPTGTHRRVGQRLRRTPAAAVDGRRPSELSRLT